MKITKRYVNFLLVVGFAMGTHYDCAHGCSVFSIQKRYLSPLHFVVDSLQNESPDRHVF